MANVTIGEICDAVNTTLAAAVGIRSSQSYDELKEQIANVETPLIQTYWEGFEMDPYGSTDRITFGGKGGAENTPVRQKPFIIHVDLYATRRNHMAQNMKACIDAVDALLDVLETQNVKPYFGLLDDGGGYAIKAWELTDCSRALFTYGSRGDQIQYLGARFVLTIHVY